MRVFLSILIFLLGDTLRTRPQTPFSPIFRQGVGGLPPQNISRIALPLFDDCTWCRGWVGYKAPLIVRQEPDKTRNIYKGLEPGYASMSQSSIPIVRLNVVLMRLARL